MLGKDRMKVSLADHMLTIKSEKVKEEEVKDAKYFRLERSDGAVAPTLELPRDVRRDKIKATFKNGVLEVQMPKTEEAKAKEINVESNSGEPNHEYRVLIGL